MERRVEIDKLLTLNEVANQFRVCPRTIRRWIETDDFPSFKLGTEANAPLRFFEGDVETWLYNWKS